MSLLKIKHLTGNRRNEEAIMFWAISKGLWGYKPQSEQEAEVEGHGGSGCREVSADLGWLQGAQGTLPDREAISLSPWHRPRGAGVAPPSSAPRLLLL